MFLTEKKKHHRQISDLQIIYDGALCDNVISRSHYALAKQLQRRWRRNRKAASVCYSLQFPWENWKHGRGKLVGGLQHITYWYLISFLGARENSLLLSLLKNGSCLIDPLYSGVCTKRYLNKRSYFGNFRINCNGVQSLEICHSKTWNIFSHQFWFKKLRFQPTKLR